jgi:hypothetical protein
MGHGSQVPEDRRHHGQVFPLLQDVHRVRQELRERADHHQRAVPEELQIRCHHGRDSCESEHILKKLDHFDILKIFFPYRTFEQILTV